MDYTNVSVLVIRYRPDSRAKTPKLPEYRQRCLGDTERPVTSHGFVTQLGEVVASIFTPLTALRKGRPWLPLFKFTPMAYLFDLLSSSSLQV